MERVTNVASHHTVVGKRSTCLKTLLKSQLECKMTHSVAAVAPFMSIEAELGKSKGD